MGDLHSIAYSSNLHSSSLGWDFHNSLGVFNADMSHFMDSTPPFFSHSDPDCSTGYLQDALFEFTDRAKRRRLLFDKQFNETPAQGYWDSNQTENYPDNSSYLRHISGSNRVLDMETTEEEMSVSEVLNSSSSSPKDSANTNFIPNKETLYSFDPPEDEGKRKKAITRVVYPFAVVKPGGIEGDLTLNDINQRILMPPTRPVRHPVGDYACRPLVVSPHGPGLSGKAVVAFTRVHTQGRRGTITIIRTKD